MKSTRLNQDARPPNPSTTSSENYKIFPTENFIKEAKSLKKKYPNIKDDFHELQKQLKKDPITGNDPLGKDCYKVRMTISGKNSGKSGAARVIINVKIIDNEVYVLSVYDKSDKEDIYDKELKKLLDKLS